MLTEASRDSCYVTKPPIVEIGPAGSALKSGTCKERTRQLPPDSTGKNIKSKSGERNERRARRRCEKQEGAHKNIIQVRGDAQNGHAYEALMRRGTKNDDYVVRHARH